jgi:DNA-binding NtrC family response regulator
MTEGGNMSRKHGKRLALIVAPDSETRASLYSTVERKGWLVATSSQGVQALRSVAISKPDVVLVEHDPQDPSFDFLRFRIKSLSPRTRVITVDSAQSRGSGQAI